ncbi:hypothetical protein NX059_005513 [Plenodomus lindquistii]|nr:hypothetical protein NX059_005513 [Plenodomus lindquistii]
MDDSSKPVATALPVDQGLTEQEVYLLADAVLANMKRLQTALEALKEHINTQLSGPKAKSLHEWDPYTDYRNLSTAADSLAYTVLQFVPSHLPETTASSYRRRARLYSTSTSHLAIFILNHTNQKCSTCLADLDTSDLSADAKQAAQTQMTSEVSKLLDHCSRATTRVWCAYDTMEASLQPTLSQEIAATVDATVRRAVASMREEYANKEKLDYEHYKATHHSTRTHVLQTLFWIVVTAASFYSTAQSLFPAAFIPPLYTPSSQMQAQAGAHLYHQTLELVERTNAITNLTGELYDIQLQDLNTRYKALELSAEDTSLRIDNLVDALGVPNELGNYYVAAQDGGSEGMRRRVEKMQEDVEGRLQRLQDDIKQMRKGIQRMDIRLTKRLDKVGGGGSL